MMPAMRLMVVSLVLTPMLLAGVVHLSVETSERVPSVENGFSVTYEGHGPIVISGDDMFHTYAESEKWDGFGSIDEPYIIEGYSIAHDGDCIVLSNISLYFEIHDCVLNCSDKIYSGIGMSWLNVTHGKVFDAIVYEKSDGMFFTDSPSAVVKGCVLYNCTGSAIQFVGSEVVSVENCQLFDIGFNGVSVSSGSNKSIITKTEIRGAEYDGVQISRSHGCVVKDSEIYDNQAGGVVLELSDNCVVENNNIRNNWYQISPKCGVYLYHSNNCSILGNLLVENARDGIYLQESNYTLIHDNTVHKNSDHGIALYGSHHADITENNITDNGWWPQILNTQCGIYIADSLDSFIQDNYIFNNTLSGISAEDAEHVTITENEIRDNVLNGIRGGDCYNISIIANHVANNGWQMPDSNHCGIWMHGNMWVVEENYLHNNTMSGIVNLSNDSRIVDNSILNSEWAGVSNDVYYHSVISDNFIAANRVGIVVDKMNRGSNITNNIVCDNIEYGILSDCSGDSRFYGNDIGWNGQNALEIEPSSENFWYDNVTHTGNHWSDFNGTGPYDIHDMTGVINRDLYPSCSLSVTPADNITLIDFPRTSIMVWPAHALHPGYYALYVDGLCRGGGDWNGSDISVVISGLGGGVHEVTLEAFHGYVKHSVNATAYINVIDLTPPEWLSTPSNQTITEGEAFSAQFEVSDQSGIDSFWTYDTDHFKVVWNYEEWNIASVLIMNASVLHAGGYIIRIYVNDTAGNISFIKFILQVQPETITGTTFPATSITTTAGLSPVDFAILIAVGAGGAAVVIIVNVVLSRRRG